MNTKSKHTPGKMVVDKIREEISARNFTTEIKRLKKINGELLAALVAITSNEHIELGDLIYKVRDSELKGWDGPEVKQWRKAVEMVNAAIAKAKDE